MRQKRVIAGMSLKFTDLIAGDDFRHQILIAPMEIHEKIVTAGVDRNSITRERMWCYIVIGRP